MAKKSFLRNKQFEIEQNLFNVLLSISIFLSQKNLFKLIIKNLAEKSAPYNKSFLKYDSITQKCGNKSSLHVMSRIRSWSVHQSHFIGVLLGHSACFPITRRPNVDKCR